MKKTITIVSLLLLVFSAKPLLASPEDYAEQVNGNPDENPNHFVWDLMADMQAPDDPDCSALAVPVLEGFGYDNEQATMLAGFACTGIAGMRTSMESEMSQGMEGPEGLETVETNLFDAPNWHSVENLYFEHSVNGTPDGRIAFSVPIDFMSYEFLNFMSSFGENMEAETGYISLDADVVGGFANYGASLTMYNVPEFESPEILVDGGRDTEGIVSNLVYDRDSNTITFSAAHFTSFEVVEASSDEEPDTDTIKARKYFNPLTGKWSVRVMIKGDNYDRSTEITAGNRAAYKVRYKDENKIVAHFSLDKLQMSGQDSLILRVLNGNETEKLKKQLRLSELTSRYRNLK